MRSVILVVVISYCYIAQENFLGFSQICCIGSLRNADLPLLKVNQGRRRSRHELNICILPKCTGSIPEIWKQTI